MKRVPHVGVESAVVRSARGELGEDARAEHAMTRPPSDPDEHYEQPAVHVARDDRRVHEDARADDAAHHDECGIAGTEAAQQFRRRLAGMFALATFFLTALATTVAQVAAARPPPHAHRAPKQPLENGACLDSARAVPQVLQPPVSRAMQIVRIDEVVSTATMMPGEIIGFLYTTEDGSTWLGQRSSRLHVAGRRDGDQPGAGRHARAAAKNVTGFPPQSRYGVATKYPQLLQGPDSARRPRSAAHSQLAPCVAWPPGRALPDPSM